MIKNFDKEAYLDANSDVKVAMENGDFPTVDLYLKRFGLDRIRDGKCKFHKDLEPFNEIIYLEEFPEVQSFVDNGKFISAFDHFCKEGYTTLLKYLQTKKDILEESLNPKNDNVEETRCIIGFNEEAYLDANLDVKVALENSNFPNLEIYLEHFGLERLKHGRCKFHKDFERYSEEKYLELNPDIKKLVEEGKLKSGFEHFCFYGYKEIVAGSRKWSKIEEVIKEIPIEEKLFNKPVINGLDEKSYLEANPAVQNEVETGLLESGLDHVQKFGLKEIEAGTRPFHKDFGRYSEKKYLQLNLDIKKLVEEGKLKSGFEHFCFYGYKEIVAGSRKWSKIEEVIKEIPIEEKLFNKPIINGLDEKSYLEANPAVQNEVETGLLESGLDHLQKYGLKEIEAGTRPFHKDFERYSEKKYLQLNPDIKKLVENKEFTSAFEHFCKLGYAEIVTEKREWNAHIHQGNKENEAVFPDNVYKAFDEEYYLNINPDIKSAGMNPLEHYLTTGWREGRMPNAWFDPLYYIDTYEDVKNKGIEPLGHYISIGQFEERSTKYAPVIDSNSFNFQFSQNNNKSEDYIAYEDKKEIVTDIKLIAYYLPQFHPIPQNDTTWGKGFTEWTNVTKAIPQFHEHYQPRLAGELGYYDLRLAEVQKRQIELAKNYGLHGFCYHYYWFDGKKIMDTPLQQILDNPDLDFPFCINWANENWTKKWDGLDQDIILAQKHTLEDDSAFIEAIAPILKDKRYIRLDNKPLIMVYRPKLFPNILETVSRWRKYARENGIGEIYLVLSHAFEHINPVEIGFDAAAEFAPNSFHLDNVTNEYSFFNENYEGQLYDYESAIDYSISYEEPGYTKFRSLCPSWDNEARKPGKGASLVNSSPNTYSKWLEYILYYTEKYQTSGEKLVFVNAWNEWAEGAYLEPDRKYGYAYLDKTYDQIKKFTHEKLSLINQSKQNTKQNDTAVVLHLFYIDLWDEMKSKLLHLDNKFDLYVNVNNGCDIDFLKKVREDFPYAVIFSCENRGRDILPFIEMMQHILPLDYAYICKIHSKKSFHRTDGDDWRNHLIDSLLTSKENISQSKRYLDQGAGVVVAKDNLFSYRDWVGSNEDVVNAFAQKANIEITEDFYFPAGSIFWFKPVVFRKLIKHIDLREFTFENGQIDGTMAHALERIVGLLCNDLDLTIEEI